jgi:hypothetical protein
VSKRGSNLSQCIHCGLGTMWNWSGDIRRRSCYDCKVKASAFVHGRANNEPVGPPTDKIEISDMDVAIDSLLWVPGDAQQEANAMITTNTAYEHAEPIEYSRRFDRGCDAELWRALTAMVEGAKAHASRVQSTASRSDADHDDAIYAARMDLFYKLMLKANAVFRGSYVI